VLSEFVTGNIGDDLDKERFYVDRYVRSVRELLGLRVELSDTPKGPQGPRTGFSDAQRLERDSRRSMEQAAGSIDIQAPDLDAILDASKKAQEAAKAMSTEAAAIYDRTRTPLEDYGRDVARVNELLTANAISAETASREIQRLGTVLGQGVQAQVEATDAGQAWARQQQLIADVTESSLTPFERLAQKYYEIAEAERAGLDPTIGAKARQSALAELAATADQTSTLVNDRTISLLDSIRSATEGYASDITDIFFDTTNSIGDMFSDLLDRISRMIVEQQIVRPLIDNLMGSLSGLFSGGISEIDLSKLPKRRALGGPVTAGTPYLVGEQGPELFMPQQSGQIVPNGAVGNTLAISFNVNSLDPSSAAAVIAGNERVITNVVRRAMVRAGYTPTL
jgi:hypothetical protein